MSRASSTGVTAPLLPTTPAYLRLQALRRADAGGLVFRGRSIPFGELASSAADLERWLAARGVGAGRPVGVLAGNEPAAVAALFALWGLGAAAVPIAVRSTSEDVAKLLTHARAGMLITDAARTTVARDAAAAAGCAAVAMEPDLPLEPRVLHRGTRRPAGAPRSPGPQSLAAIAYTSGSTGTPKGVLLT